MLTSLLLELNFSFNKVDFDILVGKMLSSPDNVEPVVGSEPTKQTETFDKLQKVVFRLMKVDSFDEEQLKLG